MEHDVPKVRMRDLARIYNELKAGIIIADPDGVIIWGNAYYSSLVKFDISKYFGRNIREISKKEEVVIPGSELLIDKLLRTGAEVNGIVKYRTDDYTITNVTPIYDENHALLFILYTVTNYSQVVRMQEQLAQSNAKATALTTQLQEAQLDRLTDRNIVLQDREMRHIFRMGLRLSSLPVSVMILGESGVGKDVLAEFIHRSGTRKHEKFIHVNLGAIPKALFESELFGYAPGAFTGATKTGKVGLIQLAHNGTLFLDEVSELPLDIQAKLLQVVQNKEVRPLGSTKSMPVDVRIISAANRDLSKMVADGNFRLDLFYRLNIVEIKIPPLRNRRDDIPMLCARFLELYNEKYGAHKFLSGETLQLLQHYLWPGNVRELRHLIESMVVLGTQDCITPDQLPDEFRHNLLATELGGHGAPPVDHNATLKTATTELELRMIRAALATYPTAARAAEALGIDASTLAKKRKKYGI